jgi:hypothetical protein
MPASAPKSLPSPLPYPALALHAKVAKFGCTRSLRGGWGRSFFQIFLRETEAEILEIWKYGMVRLSEKQTHRKLSGSVVSGQFSTQSGRNNLTG